MGILHKNTTTKTKVFDLNTLNCKEKMNEFIEEWENKSFALTDIKEFNANNLNIKSMNLVIISLSYTDYD
jgi:hypothetical protein